MSMTPAVRFKGFTDPWEQRKLGELATKVTQKNGDMAVMETFTNSAEFGVVSQLDFFDHDIAKEESIGGYFVVQPEDFVYNPRISVTAPVGPINRNRLGRAGVMSPLYTVFRPGDAIDNAYLEHYFETSGWHDFMQLNGNSGARSDRFSISDSVFFEMPIPYPSMKEQVSIANALESLDNLITLHQRKYDQLAVLKKALLDKMFPRDGAFVPEIRFVGFTDPWEQRKLGELATKVTQKNGDMAVMETFTNSAEFGVVSQLDFFDHDIAKEESIGGYFVVQPEDFVYNPRISVTAPVGPINRNRLGRAGVMSPLYTVFRPGDAIDNAYLEHYFETSGWHDFMQLNGNSGARSDRFSISDSVFFEMPIPYPSMKEQVSIANALESLDNLITLHLREPPAWLTL